MSNWYLYILECADKTLYTGITTDPDRRLREHNSGKGARYTRSRIPVKQVFLSEVSGRSRASQLEAAIKKLPRQKKSGVISGKINIDKLI